VLHHDKPHKVNKINFRRHFTIYNDTKESITFNYVGDSGNQPLPFYISPNKFLLSGKHGMENDRSIELTLANECKKVFKLKKEEYLLFEYVA
jgi:hypothetical protein